MEEQRPVPGQVQIKADEKDLQGQYSNLVMLHHNLEEFTLNFIYIFPNGPQGKLLSSVIVSPGHAKRILRALAENISRYEAQFGPIKAAPECRFRTVKDLQKAGGWTFGTAVSIRTGPRLVQAPRRAKLFACVVRRACSSGG